MNFKIKYLTILLILITLSCNSKNNTINIDSSNPNKKELMRLIPLLESKQEFSENRFTIMNEIISKMMNDSPTGQLSLVITDYIDKNSNDPYNSYYLMALASVYLEKNHNDFAKYYLHQVVNNYPNLEIQGESTHYRALKALVRISEPNLEKVTYYNRLIKLTKKDSNNIGVLYYQLGKTLEECEMWEKSIIAYQKFLNDKSTIIPNEPDAWADISKKVGFYLSDRKWVVKDLNTLVDRVRYAINTKNPGLLDRYRAYDFFIINWKSKYSDLRSSYPMESSVLTSMSITTKRNLDSMSNENEAYLAVSGNRWSSSIWAVFPTWYFYFKRVDFPMDPEIHGGWEWAGIYLGEKL